MANENDVKVGCATWTSNVGLCDWRPCAIINLDAQWKLAHGFQVFASAVHLVS